MALAAANTDKLRMQAILEQREQYIANLEAEAESHRESA